MRSFEEDYNGEGIFLGENGPNGTGKWGGMDNFHPFTLIYPLFPIIFSFVPCLQYYISPFPHIFPRFPCFLGSGGEGVSVVWR